MNDQLLNEWFDNLKYEDKCVAIYLCADDTYTPQELKKKFTTKQLVMKVYGVQELSEKHYQDWYNSDLEDKAFAYEKMNK